MAAYDPPKQKVPEFDTLLFEDLTDANISTISNNTLITSDNTNGNYYIPFAKTAGTGAKPLYIDDNVSAPITINPSTGTLNLANAVKVSAVSTSNHRISIGLNAGNVSQDIDGTIAIGYTAGQTQGAGSVAIGRGTGRSQAINCVALGINAGQTSQQNSTVAIGSAAGQTSQFNGAVAIGNNAGNSSQSSLATAVGPSAGQTSQGASAVAIGNSAGTSSQGGQAVAIGRLAGTTSQGGNSVAIGNEAGKTTQLGNSVAIGNLAGTTDQGATAVAIGSSAGNSGQKTGAIAIGSGGQVNQGTYAIAIGSNAGTTNQGTNAIAIGPSAAPTGQHNNTIVFAATGNALNTDGLDRFYVNPIRNATQTTVLGYNTTSKEITYYTPAALSAPVTVMTAPENISFLSGMVITPKVVNYDITGVAYGTQTWLQNQVIISVVKVQAGTTYSNVVLRRDGAGTADLRVALYDVGFNGPKLAERGVSLGTTTGFVNVPFDTAYTPSTTKYVAILVVGTNANWGSASYTLTPTNFEATGGAGTISYISSTYTGFVAFPANFSVAVTPSPSNVRMFVGLS